MQNLKDLSNSPEKDCRKPAKNKTRNVPCEICFILSKTIKNYKVKTNNSYHTNRQHIITDHFDFENYVFYLRDDEGVLYVK